MSSKSVIGNFRNRKENATDVTFADFNNPFDFYALLLNSNELISWLMSNGLLKPSMKCEKCNSPCNLQKRERAPEGKTWRCVKNKNHEVSIRKFSFFSNIKYTIQDSLVFIREMILGSTLKKACVNGGIAYGHTACDYANFIRELFKTYVHAMLQEIKFRGIVEIDESLFGRKIKYHRGAKKNKQIWIFGLVERETNRLLLFPVEDRSEATLVPIIKKYVEEGATIYSDGWAAYSKLSQHGFNHFVVVHKETFKATFKNADGSIREVHTNQIEGAWAHAKNHFKYIYGTSPKNFTAHLCEILWRSHNRGNVLLKFFEYLVKIYDVESESVKLNYPQNIFQTISFEESDKIYNELNDEEDFLKEMDVTGLLSSTLSDEKGDDETINVDSSSDEMNDTPQSIATMNPNVVKNITFRKKAVKEIGENELNTSATNVSSGRSKDNLPTSSTKDVLKSVTRKTIRAGKTIIKKQAKVTYKEKFGMIQSDSDFE